MFLGFLVILLLALGSYELEAQESRKTIVELEEKDVEEVRTTKPVISLKS